MRIAITGGIAEGKSTVLGYCREAGYSTLSADEVARNLFDREDIQEKISLLFGADKPVSRARVREEIARDPALRKGLNKITHEEILRALLAGDEQFIEIPLLLETCTQYQFDKIWVVTCGPFEQRNRLLSRYPNAHVDWMLSTQLPTSAKTVFADTIIRTNAKEETVKRNVLEKAKMQLRVTRS